MRSQMGRIFKQTAVWMLLLAGALALSTCSHAPQTPPAPAEALSVAPPPQKSVMFDSDPDGDWNIFPDPTSGEVGVYHKGQYLGEITGDEAEEPPQPHPNHPDPNSKPAPDEYR